jgi:hypothetical protein
MSVATYYGANEILTAFEDQAKKPYFSMWVKNACCLYYDGNDMEIAKEMIRKKIESFARANNFEIIVLSLHNTLPDKKTGLYEKNSPAILLYCQSKHEPADRQMSGNDNLFPLYNLIEKQNAILSNFQETQNALISKVNALEAEEEDTESVGSSEEILLDKINGIVNSPLGALATTYLPRILDRFLPQQNKIAGLAGADETDLETTINILFSKGVKLEHLQKLASMPENKIKMLLTML